MLSHTIKCHLMPSVWPQEDPELRYHRGGGARAARSPAGGPADRHVLLAGTEAGNGEGEGVFRREGPRIVTSCWPGLKRGIGEGEGVFTLRTSGLPAAVVVVVGWGGEEKGGEEGRVL